MHDQLTLQINKVNISVDRDRLKYDQNERGKIVDVTVLDTDGLKAYDLTGKNIRFFDLKQGTPPKIISDDGSTSTGGKFIRTPENDKLGKFSYQFQEFTYQQSGEAHFEFYTDKDHVDVTSHFAIDIIAEGQIAPDNSSYVSSMAELIDQLKAATDHASDSIGALTTASDTAKKTATDAIQAMQDQVATYAKQVTDAQAQWVQTKQDIDNRANAQLSSIQDLDKAQVDAAVKSITDKRDLALKQLNDDKTAKLNAIQQDYNSWKTNTIDDFTRSVQPLKDSITENSEQLNQVSKQVNDTVTNMAALEKQFNSVDFTKFAKLTDLANYYTKNDVDNIVSDLRAKIATAGAVKTVDGNSPDSNGNVVSKAVIYCDSPQAAYDASTADKFHLYAYDMNNEAAEGYVAGQRVTIETLHNDIQTLQSQMSSKANTSDLANLGKVKTVNGNSPDSNGNVNVPAPDLSGYATKSDLATAGKMKTISVNGGAKVAPDANGNANITVATVDISGKADKTDITNLANRITALENKKPIRASSQDDAVAKSQNSNNEYYW